MFCTLEIRGPEWAESLGAKHRHTFTESGGTIGRTPFNDWVLPGDYVSAEHAVISFADGVFYIEDRSRNGVFINDPSNRLKPVRRVPLRSGDRILIDPFWIDVAIRDDDGTALRREESEQDLDLTKGFGDAFSPQRPREPLDLRSLEPPARASIPRPSAPPAALPAPPYPDISAPAPMSVQIPHGSSPSDAGLARSSSDGKGRYTVWFGTNRQPVLENGRITGFSSERGTTVHHGWCRVAIPESHKIGSIGSPWWKRLIARRDDRLKILRLTSVAEDLFWQKTTQAMNKLPLDDRTAVVFLHGYNVSFQNAALRAAQLGFDLGITGVMAFYSWPSKGALSSYPADEATVEASEGYIAEFLTRMAVRSGAAKVHIIAHSMGNRGLLRAVDRIALEAQVRSRTPFDQIILAAPDVDQDTFKRLSVAYQQVAQRTTLYVCSKDRAVEASHWLHDFPRAGLTPPVTVVPGVDTVNVSNLDLTLLGHGYVAEAREVLADIHTLLREGTPPERRFGMRKGTTAGGTYWTVGH